MFLVLRKDVKRNCHKGLLNSFWFIPLPNAAVGNAALGILDHSMRY